MSRIFVSLIAVILTLGLPDGVAARQSLPSELERFSFTWGTWEVTGRRGNGQGGWIEYEAFIQIEPTTIGGNWGIEERWTTAPWRWDGEADLGASLRVWDAEKEEWFTRMWKPSTPAGWGGWTPFIWPEWTNWVESENGLEMEVRSHSDFISDHEDAAGIERLEGGGWRVWAARKPVGQTQFYLWEEFTAEPVKTSAGLPGTAISPDGGVETVWEGFHGSRGLATDPDGNAYIGASLGDPTADHIPIFRIAPDGTREVYADHVGRPAGLVWTAGALYAKVVLGEVGSLIRIEADGSAVTIADLPGDMLAVDPRGVAWTMDVPTGKLQRVQPDGTVDLVVDDPRLAGDLGSAWDEVSQRLYLADFANGQIHSVDSEGVIRFHSRVPGFSGGGSAWLALHERWLYVTGFTQEQIFRVSLDDASVEWIAGDGFPGREDGPLHEARFRSPNGIAVSPDGQTLWVADLRDLEGTLYTSQALRRITLPTMN